MKPMKFKFMKHLAIATLLASGVAQAQLHPADAYDIKSEARFAVLNKFVKADDPAKKSDGYEVPVVVNGLKCRVLVIPYSPKSNMEPPVRWKASEPVCGK
jgi:hypothetical protein